MTNPRRLKTRSLLIPNVSRLLASPLARLVSSAEIVKPQLKL
jgi:hypothetical protein